MPVTSDKGLCGGLNSNVIREIKSIIHDNRSAFKIFCVGEKGVSAL